MEIIEKALLIAKKKTEEKKFEDAEILSDQILKIDQNNIFALELLAISKKYLNKPDESLKTFEKIVKLQPLNYQNLNNLGLLHMKLGHYNEAINCFLKASLINNNKNNHWRNLACVFREKEEFENSINFYNISLTINKNDEDLVGLAESYAELLDIKNSIKYLKEALKINKKNTSATVDLAYAYFLNGEFEKGYKQYQIRFKHYQHLKEYNRFKQWKGKKGKILLFCEQGIGDLFNFLRFSNLVSNASLLVPEDVYELLSKQNFNFKIIKEIKEDFDYQCSIVDLPYILKISTNEIEKENKPYIKSIKKCNFSNYKDFLKVGICWAGNPNHPRDKFRSCELKLFKKLTNEKIKLFSLQKDTRKRYRNGQTIDLCADSENMKIVDMSPFINSWSDTAAIIDELDLVISVDTSILHLAGAMGKRCFGLLPYLPDWRWSLNTKNIWYKNVKIFKQTKLNDWESVFESLKSNLKKTINFEES